MHKLKYGFLSTMALHNTYVYIYIYIYHTHAVACV